MPERLSFEKFCQLMLIRDKAGGLVPFVWNPMQQQYIATKRANQLENARRGLGNYTCLLKSRQWGGSTVEAAQSLYLSGTLQNYVAALVAPTQEDAEALFSNTALTMYSSLCRPELLIEGKPAFIADRKTPNASELDFPELFSKFYCMSGDSRISGAGRTHQRLWISEFAKFEQTYIDEFWAGMMPTVHAENDVTLESTPNGIGGKFYDIYQEAKERPGQPWWAIFFEWFRNPEYTLSVGEELAHEILAQVASGQGDQFASEEQDLAQRLASKGIILTAGQWAWRRSGRIRYKDIFFQEYPEDDTSCFLTSGRPYFPPDLLDKFIRKCCDDPIRKEHGDEVWIWENEIPKHDYFLTCDTSQGLDVGPNTDYSTICIRDKQSRNDVLEFRGRVGTKELSNMIVHYAQRYNGAKVIVERNGLGRAVIENLQELNCPNVYRGDDGKPGWLTNVVSRSVALDFLNEALIHKEYAPRSTRFVGEMRTFTMQNGKPQALSGYHDDLVLTHAILTYCMLHARELAWAGFAF